VFVLFFSGCDLIKELYGDVEDKVYGNSGGDDGSGGEIGGGGGEADGGGEVYGGDEPGTEEPGGGGGTVAGSVWKGVPINGAYSIPNIKYKFGVSEEVTGTASVEAAFQELHAFIQAGGLTSKPNVIKLGDYIDLEGGLTVIKDVGGEIALSFSKEADKPKLRLIVVGINSFTKNGNNTPHVVFQFADFPGTHRMNLVVSSSENGFKQDTNAGGYAGSEMYPYVKGNFFTGLKRAGVTEDVLWPPTRTVSTNNTTGAGTLTDLLWLPTEREMAGEGVQTNAPQGETAENQARLEYYTTPELRKKSGAYWLASTIYSSSTNFSYVASNGVTGGGSSSASLGIAPAFCVQ
jgi:hypothetical protein